MSVDPAPQSPHRPHRHNHHCELSTMAHGAFEIIVFWLVGCAAVADAWVPVTAAARTRVSTTTTISRVPLLLGHTASVSLTRLQLAAAGGGGGFGGGGGGSSGNDNSNKKEVKLKPKQQWDRYTTVLKKETPVAVAVRVVSGGADGAWFEVGTIKSQGDSMTPIAVARQRALLAEVRRQHHT